MRSSTTSFGLLLLRLALGAIFIAHGGQKVFGWWGGSGLEPFIKNIQEMGLPTYLAYVSAYTEFLGGFAVALGLLTRLAGFGLAVVMGVAVWKVHLANGFFLKNSGFEYCLALGSMALCLLFAGAGSISLDRIYCRKKPKSESSVFPHSA